MTPKQRANLVRDLKNNPVFIEVVGKIQSDATAVFLNGQSSLETIKDAHDIIRALNKIENYFQTVFSEEAISDKRE